MQSVHPLLRRIEPLVSHLAAKGDGTMASSQTASARILNIFTLYGNIKFKKIEFYPKLLYFCI